MRGGLPSQFGAVRDVVKRRRQQGGARKGRVLYVLQNQQPLAAIAYHVPARGPIEVIAVGADRAIQTADAARLQGHLLACLEEAAVLLGRGDALAWVTDVDNTAEVAKKVHGFRRSRKPSSATTRYYLSRPIMGARRR